MQKKSTVRKKLKIRKSLIKRRLNIKNVFKVVKKSHLF